MADAGFLVTPRQQRNVYVHGRTNQTVEQPDYIYNSESNEDASADFAGVIQGTLNSYDAANGKTIDVDAGAGVTNQVLTYNPITDEYGISSGEYVL